MKPDTIAREYSQIVRSALGARVHDIILFGSRARGDNTEWSDYDMLVIVDKRDREIVKEIRKLAVQILDEHDRLVGNIIYDTEEWERKRQYSLGRNIQREGIRI